MLCNHPLINCPHASLPQYNLADIQWMNVMREPIDREQSTFYYDVRSISLPSHLLLLISIDVHWILLARIYVGARLRRCWTCVAGIDCVAVDTWSSTTVYGPGECETSIGQ